MVKRWRGLCAACAVAFGALLWPLMSLAAPAETVRLGVLKFGTVEWELDTIVHNKLDAAEGVALEVLALAGKNATAVALQAGEVDMIVSDWLWVTRQRAEGADFTFYPFSTAIGAVMVPADSTIAGIADLKGKRLGIAGGPLDKSWLLLQAVAQEREGFDLAGAVAPAFAAPPLLSEQLRAGRLDAVLTFWHYAARLQAAGLRPAVTVAALQDSLGLSRPIPMIGYVFRESWAAEHPDAVEGFLRASLKAKSLLRNSDPAWQRLRPLMRVEDEATFAALRDGFRRGIPDSWDAMAQKEAEQLFAILAKQGGKKLVGPADRVQAGTFYQPRSF